MVSDLDIIDLVCFVSIHTVKRYVCSWFTVSLHKFSGRVSLLWQCKQIWIEQEFFFALRKECSILLVRTYCLNYRSSPAKHKKKEKKKIHHHNRNDISSTVNWIFVGEMFICSCGFSLLVRDVVSAREKNICNWKQPSLCQWKTLQYICTIYNSEKCVGCCSAIHDAHCSPKTVTVPLGIKFHMIFCYLAVIT